MISLWGESITDSNKKQVNSSKLGGKCAEVAKTCIPKGHTFSVSKMYWKVFCLFTRLPSMLTIKWGRKSQNRASKIQLVNVTLWQFIFFLKWNKKTVNRKLLHSGTVQGAGPHTACVQGALDSGEHKQAKNQGHQIRPQGFASVSK